MKYDAAQLFTTMMMIRNVSWAANHHIRVISDSGGSCDTEDWSNDDESSALTGINYILKDIQIENSYFKLYLKLK